MTHPLRVGLQMRPQGLPISAILDVWRMADEAGFDHLWGFDHVISLDRTADQPVFDGWTFLPAAAGVTRRARLGLLVTGNLYRHPGILAKQAVTVDHLSGGRLEMGLGAGWKAEEFHMLGMPFPTVGERIGRLEEACSVLKLLWTQERASFTGRYYQLDDAIAEPKPVQTPHPPLWIGGSGPRRTLRVVAVHADVWSSNARSFEEDVASARILDEHCHAIGRDPGSLRRCVAIRWAGRITRGGVTYPVDDLPSDIDETCRCVERYYRAGFSEVILMVNTVGEDSRRMAEVLTTEVLPRVRSLG
jgi:F420-dependent oxidoreductase-like protein